MKIRIPDKPSVWICPVCGKADFPDNKEQLARPEHISHRGMDIGTCKGTMIPLYTKEDIIRINSGN